MHKLANTRHLLSASVLLMFASCSTLLSSRKTVVEEVEIAVDSLLVNPIDSVELESIVEEVALIEPDTIEVEPVPVPVEDVVEQHEIFHFEDSQTAGVVISEYKNMVIGDMELDLRKENSYYPADGHVTSPYGWRSGRMHAGVDIKAYKGDNIYAAFDGVVRLAKYYGSYGNCLVIRHYNGLETVYGHATKLLVSVNDEVKAGDVIAYAGSTGRSTGSHLHFEVRVGGNYINPSLVLDTDKREVRDTTLYVTMRNGRLFASINDSEQAREDYILEQISIKYHIVKSGDVLSRIAANNGTTVATICRLNGISSKSILRIGQRLIVRDGVKPSTTTTKATTTTTTTTTTAAPTTTNSIQYTIKSGDTLSEIASRHNTTVSKICSMNGISTRTTLKIGRKLSIPSSGNSAATISQDAAQYHTVKSGDTLSGIAQKYNTTVTTLCNLNNISRTSTLNLNQKIRVK